MSAGMGQLLKVHEYNEPRVILSYKWCHSDLLNINSHNRW